MEGVVRRTRVHRTRVSADRKRTRGRSPKSEGAEHWRRGLPDLGWRWSIAAGGPLPALLRHPVAGSNGRTSRTGYAGSWRARASRSGGERSGVALVDRFAEGAAAAVRDAKAECSHRTEGADPDHDTTRRSICGRSRSVRSAVAHAKRLKGVPPDAGSSRAPGVAQRRGAHRHRTRRSICRRVRTAAAVESNAMQRRVLAPNEVWAQTSC